MFEKYNFHIGFKNRLKYFGGLMLQLENGIPNKMKRFTFYKM